MKKNERQIGIIKSRIKDLALKAKRPGKRLTKWGTKYYERRSDKLGSNL